jgi:opacity protein-like surface antigen
MDINFIEPSNFFVQGSIGVNRPSHFGGNASLDQLKNSAFYSVSIGRSINNLLNCALEFNRSERSATGTDIKSPRLPPNAWSIKSYGIFFNGMLNMTNEEKVRPYMKLGMGYSFNKVGAYTRILGPSHQSLEPRVYHAPGISKNNAAYQIGVGVIFQGSTHYYFNIDYSMIFRGRVEAANYAIFEETGDFVKFTPVSGKLIDNIVSVGVRFRF